jgi:hypothetical protein
MLQKSSSLWALTETNYELSVYKHIYGLFDNIVSSFDDKTSNEIVISD